MSDTEHFEGFTCVHGNFYAEIRFDRFSRQFAAAQEWLAEQVLADCKPFMPFQTGSMTQRSYVAEGGKHVVFLGPYARMQYEGKVMVDAATGKGPMKIPDGSGGYLLRFRKGATLVPTDRPLNYSTTANPQATDHWFDAAKAANQDYWLERVKRIGGGGEDA